MSSSQLLVSRIGRIGSICLNRPEALNSLTLEMVRAFTRALGDFASDPSICAVFVEGAGNRGLCAGGDIRRLYAMRTAGSSHYKTFWREEYELNARISTYPKPYIVVMDGVTMGGGIGISAHGNCRIVTERSRLAMPETSIGFVPDVGGTWLLTRTGGIGLYLALSGVSFGPADALHIGFADHYIALAQLVELKKQLAAIGDAQEVRDVLLRFSQPPGVSPLARRRALLDSAMGCACIEEIIAALEREGSEFARQAAADIRSRSPTSLKVTHELLKRAMVADRLEQCLVNEFRAATRLLETHDLYEGIRAAIIDRDRRPNWSPSTLAGVDEAMVNAIVAGAGDADPCFSPRATSLAERTPT